MPCHEHYLFTKGCACAAAAVGPVWTRNWIQSRRPCTITSLLCWVRAFLLWFLCAHQVLGEQISRTVAIAGMYWQAYNTSRIWNVKVGTKKWSTYLCSFKTIRSDGLDFFFPLVLQLAKAAADWPGGLLFLNIYRQRNMFSIALPIHIHCSDVDGGATGASDQLFWNHSKRFYSQRSYSWYYELRRFTKNRFLLFQNIVFWPKFDFAFFLIWSKTKYSVFGLRN